MSLHDLVGNGPPLPSSLSQQERMRLVSGNRLGNPFGGAADAIGDDINVGDLVGAHNYRREQRAQVYEMMYRKCCSRIRHANDIQYSREVIFYVPEVQLWNGVPRYQINAVIGYIMIKLKQKGFDVKFQAPNAILINWERLVAGQVQLGDMNVGPDGRPLEKEVRFSLDEVKTQMRPHDQGRTPAERLIHTACQGDCCTKSNDPNRGSVESRSARAELERRRQQEEIDRLIAKRDNRR